MQPHHRCDIHSAFAGVIVESEDLHREAYNASFAHHDIRCGGSETVATWSEAFYDDLSNKVGGGKPKMRWYFGMCPMPIAELRLILKHQCIALPPNPNALGLILVTPV